MLRVIELQKILSFLNISFAGRKSDLQSRHNIYSLLRSYFELLSLKIKEVYTQSMAEQSNMYSHMQMQPQQNPGTQVVGPANTQMVCAAAVMQNPAVGPGNVLPFLPHIPTQMPKHPDVRLKKLAFYDVSDTLIKPSSLSPRNTQHIQELPFYFTLTTQQTTDIATNLAINASNKIEHATQVLVRFCLLETSCEQEDCFPPNVNVTVNNKLCQLPNEIPTNRPVNVTSNVKLSSTVTNTITVQWCPDYARSYCIAVYLVKKLTSAQLLERIKIKGVIPADYTRALIKEKLAGDADCEIATTMFKVSLNCPLGKLKMSFPCRASTCSHFQCFDANLYLQMNERKPTWNCPVCDKPAIYENLVMDGYFQGVLNSSLLKSDEVEIQIHKDGSWSTATLRSDLQFVDTPTKPVQKIEVISDDIDLIITEDVKPVKSDAYFNAQEQPTSTSNSDTVDLTLSDSDDELPLAMRRPPAKQVTSSAASSPSATNGALKLRKVYFTILK